MSHVDGSPRPSLRHRVGWSFYLIPVLVLQFIFLLPALQTGWLSDDSLNYNVRPSLEYQGLSFWEHSERDIQSWLAAGRFFPLLSYQGYGTFYWFQDVTTYKLWILILTTAAGAAVFALMRSFGVSRAVAALGVLVASVTIQFRDYHDPVLSYQGFIQLLIVAIALSLLMFNMFFKTRRWYLLAASTALLAVACAMYEAAYILIVLYAAAALFQSANWKVQILSTVPPAAVAFGFLGFAAILRSITTNPNSGYQPSFTPGVVAETFLEQVLAAMPTSFRLAADDPELATLGSLVANTSAVAAVLALAAGLLAGLFTYQASRELVNSRRAAALASIGLLLLLVPAIPISLATKYQVELKPGWAHLPVLIQIFGFGISAAVLVLLVSRWLGGRHVVLVALLSVLVGTSVAYVTAFDRVSNELTAARASAFKRIMEGQQEALARGAVETAAPESRIYVKGSSWLSPYFFYRFSGVRYDVRPIAAATYELEPRDPTACRRDPKAVYLYEDDQEVVNGVVGVKLTCIGPLT